MELDHIGNYTDVNLMKVNAALCFVKFFYEWQVVIGNLKTTKPSQPVPCYIYAPQPKAVQIEMQETWRKSMKNLELLKMNAL